jgi:enhancing lycopene biosynthesis protein 2
MKKVAVVLSGCGVFDGAEIHESVLTMLAVARAGAQYECLSIDMAQHRVVNHFTGKATREKRNVLVESARIARGRIRDITQADAADYDAVILPGGVGAVTNLSNYAEAGRDMAVRPELVRFLRAAAERGRPIGAICISPVLLACVFDHQAKVTVGISPIDADNIEAMGAAHVTCHVDEVCVDGERKLVTVPAYMLAETIADAATGIERLVHEVLQLT